jgi:hypothetical protein
MALRAGRIAAGVTLGLLMGLTGFSSAEAASASPPSTDGFQHFLDCFGAMVHDGATHQQYCAPGSNVPSNSSLGSFSGGAGLTCHPYASLTRPLFKDYDVASLGDWTDAPPANAVAPELLASAYGPCGPCGYLAQTAPLFAPFTVASLDPEIDFPTLSPAPQKHLMLTAC